MSDKSSKSKAKYYAFLKKELAKKNYTLENHKDSPLYIMEVNPWWFDRMLTLYGDGKDFTWHSKPIDLAHDLRYYPNKEFVERVYTSKPDLRTHNIDDPTAELKEADEDAITEFAMDHTKDPGINFIFFYRKTYNAF